MYKDNKNGISIKLILDTRQKNKTGLFPIRVQVIAKWVAKYYNTGKLMNEASMPFESVTVEWLRKYEAYMLKGEKALTIEQISRFVKFDCESEI